jgi:Lipid A core - O-antigen ligase and related enzymes
MIRRPSAGRRRGRAAFSRCGSSWRRGARAALAFVEKAGLWVGRLPWRSRGFVVGSALAALVGVAFLTIRWGGPFFTTGYRPAYWHVAWHEYAAHPWLGSGAGTFGDYWQRHGNQAIAGGALDAHNLYLETLAELGPIGLALLVALLGLPLVTAFRVRWHPLASAATGAYVASLSHAALDWDWEMPVVTIAGLVCGAALLVFNREDAGTRLLSARSRGAPSLDARPRVVCAGRPVRVRARSVRAVNAREPRVAGLSGTSRGR